MFRPLIARLIQRVAPLFSLSRRARIAAWILPRRSWYGFALLASRAQGKLKSKLGGNGPLTEALMLDNWLRALTFSGAFPIPWKTIQPEVLKQTPPGRGVLYCWTHVPLVEIPLNVLVSLGHQPDLIVSHPGKITEEGEFIVPGLTTRLKALSVDRRVLTKMRTALLQGKSVACLADAELFGEMSSQILQLSGKVGAFVIFQWAERQPDGTLKVTFRPAPYPLCETPEQIEENLEFLRMMNRKALEALGALPTSA